MDTGTKNIIACFILAISMLLFFSSCGKRTTSFERIEIKKDSLKIENSFELNQNATFNDIGSVKPFDAKKPMLWGGKWYYNTVIEFDKSIKKGIEVKSNENLSYKGSESEKENKETVKTDNSNLYIGLSFALGILFILYLTLRKYKIL